MVSTGRPCAVCPPLMSQNTTGKSRPCHLIYVLPHKVMFPYNFTVLYFIDAYFG
jgi:hypothetical protein